MNFQCNYEELKKKVATLICTMVVNSFGVLLKSKGTQNIHSAFY